MMATACLSVVQRFLLKYTLGMDGPTNGPTDGQTGTPSYRDAWTRLKIKRGGGGLTDHLTDRHIDL